MKTTVVVMPAFNEERTIRAVSSSILKQGVGELIVINDGSTDHTGAELDGLGVEVLENPVNQGKGPSLWRGIEHALTLDCQRIITIDADAQHDPDDIRRLYEASLERPDTIIIAARTRARENSPRLRRFANGFADFWISWASGRRITDTQSGFRLYPAALLREIETRPSRGGGFAFESELLIDASYRGFTSRGVAIETRYHPEGRKSHYRPWQDTWSIVTMVAGKLLKRRMYPLGLLRALGVISEADTKAPLSGDMRR